MVKCVISKIAYLLQEKLYDSPRLENMSTKINTFIKFLFTCSYNMYRKILFSNLPDYLYIQVLCFHFLHLSQSLLCFLVKLLIEEDGNMFMFINNLDKLLSINFIDNSVWCLCNRWFDFSYFLLSCILL